MLCFRIFHIYFLFLIIILIKIFVEVNIPLGKDLTQAGL
jgi:hypothetical protein